MRAAMGAIQHLGKNHYRVSIEGKPTEDGRRTRKTKVVRGTRAEAEAVLARMKLDEGKEIDCDLTVSQYWNVFYEPSIKSLAESTISSYKYAYDNHVEPLFGDRKMAELKARDIEQGLLKIERPGSQRNAYKLMRQMFNEAYRDELIETNPMTRRIRLKRMESYQPDILLLDDVLAWLNAIYGAPYEPILLCMLFGGLRREEACALFWEDFEFGVDMCSIRIDKTLTEVRGKVVAGPTKTAESTRTVFIGGVIAKRLLELSGVGPICPDSKGKRMRPDRVSRMYRELMKGKDAKYVPMKNLRNSYATIMQGLGASDSLISKSLGHTNLNIDYAHYFAANAPAHRENALMLSESLSNIL